MVVISTAGGNSRNSRQRSRRGPSDIPPDGSLLPANPRQRECANLSSSNRRSWSRIRCLRSSTSAITHCFRRVSIALRRREFHLFPRNRCPRPIAGGDACPGEGNRFPAEEADQPPHRRINRVRPLPSASRREGGWTTARREVLSCRHSSVAFPFITFRANRYSSPLCSPKYRSSKETPCFRANPPRRGSSFRPP